MRHVLSHVNNDLGQGLLAYIDRGDAHVIQFHTKEQGLRIIAGLDVEDFEVNELASDIHSSTLPLDASECDERIIHYHGRLAEELCILFEVIDPSERDRLTVPLYSLFIRVSSSGLSPLGMIGVVYGAFVYLLVSASGRSLIREGQRFSPLDLRFHLDVQRTCEALPRGRGRVRRIGGVVAYMAIVGMVSARMQEGRVFDSSKAEKISRDPLAVN
ncbi:hypothetical protein HYW18_00080 [Candidatus Uhrbacteria bacterium]|nr:hypothetical protein [Candidatus Uhrbacteria bacterium]